uniref:ornithine decarboxylase n=1 Tax=Sphaeramia orbicularis TaxID=375764 RepID=A0A672YK51_9TELE
YDLGCSQKSWDSEVPFHVANLDDLHQKHIRWLRTLPRVKPFYAVKCNSTPAVIRMLSTLGTGFDCASKFSKVINEALDEFFPADSGVQVIAEPGQYYVGSAFTLAVNVFAKKVVMDDVTQIRDPENDRVMMYYITDGVFGSLNFLISYPAHINVAPYLHRVI